VKRLPPGRVMLDIGGTQLESTDRRRLQHPCCGGVILFARNYESPAQLTALCEEIKGLRDPPLLIAVDQEGGRVQRFRDGFTLIPAMQKIGSLWDVDAEQGVRAAHDAALVIGTELAACGIDFSFAPVLDLDYGYRGAIGDRALHASPEAVIALAKSFITGLKECGMIAVGKHFPGHGAIETDSHHDVAIDQREFAEIERSDLRPFAELCRADLDAVIPAHIIYPRVDAQPAGFSRFWLRDVLRDQIGFKGVIFSDDLSMRGARTAGDAPARAKAAIAAGCDIVLVCNAPNDADAVLDSTTDGPSNAESARILALHRKPSDGTDASADARARYLHARGNIAALEAKASKPVA
jgi:beta-N-acetylhexosaminidase